jgi:CubicO group peptidase (beta-lactamase class C family)
MNTLRALLSVLVVAVPTAVSAQTPEQVSRVDALFTRWNTMSTPGCAVGVGQNGRPILEKAYGMADLERDVRATPATLYEAGSVSKQFTAAAIMQLVQQGKLSLEDDVRKYIPELPEYGTTVRIRHMLNHTSGLRDWGSVAAIAGWGRPLRTHTHAHVIDILSRQRALNFEPGHEYSYSNSGFNLLAVIVDRVSGMPFEEFSKKYVFEPAGLTHTQWRADWTTIVKGRSIAYDADGTGFVIDNPIENVFGNGGLLTTVGDLLIWNEVLNTGAKLGGKTFVDLMHKQGILNDGSTITYASGLMVELNRAVPRVVHTGSTSGFRAFLARYPEQKLSVALLCNVGAVNPGTVGQQVADVFLPATQGGRAAAAGRAAGANAAATSTAATADTPPTTAPATANPSPSPAGRAAGAAPPARWMPTPAQLASYAGEYYSPDAETTLVVSVEQGRLVAFRRPDTRITLTPATNGAQEFTASAGLGTVRFIQLPNGIVSQLSVRQDRVYDLRFDRVK